MTNPSTQEIELLRAAYEAFNARDIGAALALMTADVTWPKAFKGGFVQGPDEIRAYWTEQWSEIDPHVEPVAFYPQEALQVLVDVHQVVRNLAGSVLADEHVGHRFTIQNGLIQAMEVCPLPLPAPGADVRQDLVRDVVEFRGSLPELAARLRGLPWDSDQELVVVQPEHLTSIARRYVTGELSAADVESWADLIECRDDVGFGSDDLKEMVHRLANPVLEGALTHEMAYAIIRGYDEAGQPADAGDRQLGRRR